MLFYFIRFKGEDGIGFDFIDIVYYNYKYIYVLFEDLDRRVVFCFVFYVIFTELIIIIFCGGFDIKGIFLFCVLL